MLAHRVTKAARRLGVSLTPIPFKSGRRASTEAEALKTLTIADLLKPGQKVTVKVIARLQGEYPAVVEQLKARNVSAKLVKGATIIELPQAEAKRWGDPAKYDLIPEAETATLMLDLAEHGGGMTNTGSGTVVCGVSGKALRPYYIPKGYSNGEHAYFSIPGSAVTVTGYRRDDNVTVERHDIKTGNGQSWVETTELWSGELGELPETYSHYQAAAEAAHRKGNCYHCREAHYIAS